MPEEQFRCTIRFAFLVAQTFFSPCVARKCIITPMRLDPVGHTETHLMQDMHLAVSTVVRVVEWDGIRWTLFGANAATVASTSAFGLRHDAPFLVGAMAWYLWHSAGTAFCLAQDVTAEP